MGVFIARTCFPDVLIIFLFQVWKSDAKILNIIGEDDQCSPYDCIYFLKSFYPQEKTENFEIVAYPGAGHLIEPPHTPLCRLSYHKTFGMYIEVEKQNEPSGGKTNNVVYDQV